MPTRTTLALWTPLLSLPLTLALPFVGWRGLRAGVAAPLARLHYGLLTAGALLFLLGVAYWNLTPLGLS